MMLRAAVGALLGASLLGGLPAQAFTRVRLTITAGTTQCGGPGLSPPALPPLTGSLHGDTGCAPPAGDTSGLFGCEARATRAFARFVTAAVRCETARARAAFLGGPPDALVAAQAACERDRAAARLERAMGRLACPPAVMGGAEALAASLLSGPDSFTSIGASIYCETGGDATPLDPNGGAGFVPGRGDANRRGIFRCENAVWRNVARLTRVLLRCRLDAGAAATRGEPVDLPGCERLALAGYDAVAGELAARGTCPPCLDAASQAALRDRILAQARRSSGRLYPCAPGGPAFSTLTDLGLGCLYLPTGPGVSAPDGGTKLLDVLEVSGTTLTVGGSAGTGPADCTKGSGPGRHCIVGGAACTSDAECGGWPGSCALDANCYFVQPIPVRNGVLSLCLVDVIESDETGTVDLATGVVSAMEHHASRAYYTADPNSPCPRCVDGACTSGRSAGAPCTPLGGKQTTIECLPRDEQFVAALQLREHFTTALSEGLDFGAGFCANQARPGAFGRAEARRIAVAGAPAGDLRDLGPHPITLASVFCVPPTGDAGIDQLSGLPGPGVVSSSGVVQLE